MQASLFHSLDSERWYLQNQNLSLAAVCEVLEPWTSFNAYLYETACARSVAARGSNELELNSFPAIHAASPTVTFDVAR